MIYFTSDWHFCHDREFLYGPRGFTNPHDMNAAIIKNYNEIIQPDDDVYVLGDCMLNDNEEGMKCIKQLKGRIHIIRGNHDSPARLELYRNCYNVVEVCDAKFLVIKGYNIFLSHYPSIVSNYDADRPLNKRTISICGHSHTKDKWLDFDKGLIYHAELDAHDNKPVSFEQVIADIKEKINE